MFKVFVPSVLKIKILMTVDIMAIVSLRVMMCTLVDRYQSFRDLIII
jgi:hypothetical protein